MTSRRRFAAAFAALVGLTGVLVFGGSLAAQAADGLEITTTTVPYGTPYFIGGTASTVNQTPIEVRQGTDVTGGLICSIAWAADWQCNPSYAPGTYTVTARQGEDVVNGGGARASTATFTVTTPAPTVDVPPAAFPGGQIVLSGGNGFTGATINAVVTTPDAPGLTCAVGPLTGAGEWSGCTIDFDDEIPPSSTAVVSVTQTLNGVTSAVTTQSVTILSDLLQVTSPSEGSTVPWAPAITISGTAPRPTPNVSLTIDGTPSTACASLPVSAAGTWSCDVQLAAGPGAGAAHSVVANQATQSSPMGGFRVVYPNPSVSPTSYSVVQGQTVNITGTTTYPGVTISITTSSPVGDCAITTPIAAAGTAWSCPLTADDNVAGDFDLYVDQELAGNPIGTTWIGAGALSILPQLAFTYPATDTDIDWTGTTTTISGTSAVLDVPITLYRGTGGSPDAIYDCLTVPVQPDGTWSCDVAFDPGAWELYATQGGPYIPGGDLTVYIPAPVPNADPYPVSDVGYSYIEGTNTWPGGVVRVELIGSPAVCTDETASGPGVWRCDIEFGDLGTGYYSAVLETVDGGLPSRTRVIDIVAGTPDPSTLTIDSPVDDGTVTWDTPPNWFVVSGESDSISPVSVYLDGSSTPYCTTSPEGGAWSCAASTGDPAPGPGHSVLVRQPPSFADVGQPSVSADFDVLLPEPGVNGLPFAFDENEDFVFGGQQMYPGAWTQARIYNDESGSPGGLVESEDCAPAGGFWSCTVPQDLDPGAYWVEFEHFLPADGTVEGDVAGPFPLSIDAFEIPAPTLDNDDPYVLPDDDVAVFSGTTEYDDGIVHVSIELDDSVTVGCEDDGPFTPLDAGWGWTCSFDASSVESGTYYGHVYIEDEIAENYYYSDSVYFDFQVGEISTTAPTLACTFGPDGAFSVSSEQDLEYLEIYELLPADEGSSMYSSYDEHGLCNGAAGYVFPEGTQFDTDFVDGCYLDCDIPASASAVSLPPGDYVVDHMVSDGGATVGVSYEPHNWVFRIPEAPVITQSLSTTNSVVLNGTAAAGDAVRIVRPEGTELCETTATGTGAWACQFPKSSTSSARAISIDAPSGGMSAYTAPRDIAVFVPPTIPAAVPTPSTTPLPTLAPEEIALVQWLLSFGGDLSNLKPGDSFTLNISGMPVGTTIEIWMHSTPRLLGTTVGTGAPMSIDLTVPMDIENGAHEIEMIGITPLGTHYFYTSDAMVSGGVEPTAEEPLKDEPVLDEKPGDAGTGDRADPAAPSGITGTLAPFSVIASNPATIAIAGGLALALLFLVALPTELLNSSLSSNTSRLGRAYGAVDGALTKAQDWFIKVTRSRAVAALILTTIVAIIYGFVDPGFGFDIVSLRLVLSLAIAFFLLSFVASWISGLIIRRAWGAIGVVEMQPTIILFAIVGVIVARILDFSPGFLVGIAIGLELLQASRSVNARAIFVQIGVVTGLALAAWGVYSVFTPGDDFVGMLVDDTMVAVTAEGLTGALIALFPLKFLDGHDLWAVSKRLWVLAFVVVATAFALLVLPTAIQGTDVGDYGIWLLVFAVFGLVSLVVWLIFVRADKKAADAEKESVDA